MKEPRWNPVNAYRVRTDEILLYENNAWLIVDIREYPPSKPLVPLVIRLRRANVTHELSITDPDVATLFVLDF